MFTKTALLAAGLLLLPGTVAAIHPTPLFEFGSEGSGDGQFETPTAISLDDSSNIYITDSSQSRVQKFDSTGTFIQAWGSFGSDPGQFMSVEDLVFHGGFLYACDYSNNRVQKFTRTGQYLTEWYVNRPSGIDAMPNGNICVFEAIGATLKVTDTVGTPVFEVPNAPFGQLGNINNSSFLHVDAWGRIYQSEWSYQKIVRRTDFGIPVQEWGSEGTGRSQFDLAEGMDTDVHGNLFVTELINNRIQVFDSTGSYLGAWGHWGTDPGELWRPVDLAISASGRFYVLENGAKRVQVFDTPNFPPVVSVQLPAAEDRYAPGDMVPIQWQAWDDNDDDLTIHLHYTTELRLYGTTSSGAANSPSSLYQIDRDDGTATLVGPIGFDRVGAIAMDPLSGLLFGAAERAVGTESALIRIWPETGIGIEICPLESNLVETTDISFDRETNLLIAHIDFAGIGPTVLEEYSLLTGNEAYLGEVPWEGQTGAFAFAPNNQGYLILENSGTNILYYVDPQFLSGGVSSALIAPGGHTNVTFRAMDFDPLSAELFAIMNSSLGTYLVKINPFTGAVEIRGAVPDALNGLAFVAAPVQLIQTNAMSNPFLWTVPNVITHAARVRVWAVDDYDDSGFDFSSGFFAITDEELVDVPSVGSFPETRLEPAFPNPFVETSTIRFHLAEPGAAELAVYDARGRLVRTLLEGEQPGGPQLVAWDGTDEYGRSVPSGVYLIRLVIRDTTFATPVQRLK